MKIVGVTGFRGLWALNLNTILETPIMDGMKSSSLSSRIESEAEASPM